MVWWKERCNRVRLKWRLSSRGGCRAARSRIPTNGASGLYSTIRCRSVGAARICSTCIRRRWRKRRRAQRIPSGKQIGGKGFTLIEPMIVMAIVTILAGMAAPIYRNSTLWSKVSVPRNNLFTLRSQIDEFTYNKQKGPANATGVGERRVFADASCLKPIGMVRAHRHFTS